jgi:hypothetical protein
LVRKSKTVKNSTFEKIPNKKSAKKEKSDKFLHALGKISCLIFLTEKIEPYGMTFWLELDFLYFYRSLDH